MRNTLNRNTKKIDELYDLAYTNGIPVEEDCPDSIISMSVKLPDGMRIVSISEASQCAQHTKAECFAHELGHCMTDSFYAGYSPFELREKHEKTANEWAVNELVPFLSLCDAVKKGYREIWELAEYFDVSCSFIEKAIRIYQQNGQIVPSELYGE